MRKLILILVSLIFISSTTFAKDLKVYCIEEGSYFKYGPYHNVKNCSDIDSKLLEITEKFYNKLKSQSSGFETVNQHNKKIFELEYKSMIYELVAEKNERQRVLDQRQKEILAELEAKKVARKAELDRYSKQCEGSTFQKRFKRGTPEFDNCLLEEEKKALIERNRIATLPPSERYAYTCEKTYGFKKGSDNFRDCVFKIMTTEYEVQRAADQRRITELEAAVRNSNNNRSDYSNQLLEIERLKAKALQDQADAVRNRNQTDALMGLSRSLLNNNRAPSTVPNMPLNCRSVRVGNTVQTQCY